MAGTDPRDAPTGTRIPAAGLRTRWRLSGPPRPLPWLGFALDRLLLAMGASLEREIDAARGLPWLAAAFAAGALSYFLLPSEPFAPALILLALALAIVAIRLRAGSTRGFRVVLVAAMIAAGMAGAKLRTDFLATPMLERPVTATVTGWVEGREGRRGGYRLTIRVDGIAGVRLVRPPERVTVTVRGAAPGVGEGVALLARLRPPSGPVLPGGYDFARNAFYAGIGAAGFAYGTVKGAELGDAPLSVRLREPLEILREAIRSRILAALGGDTGRVASALVIGDAGGISRAAEDDLRQSGLAHVLSVSGLHMVMVAGAAFWTLRAVLALIPSLALRRPIKKWAATAALAITFFYLLISGLDVAAQRSFIMTAIVFAAMLVDRRAISMRNVAIAAFIVLALAPESILDAGFQMSFSATIALVAGFEALARRPRTRPLLGGQTALFGRAGGFLVALAGGLALTSLLGGIGTTPFALYHFQRMAPLSIVANVLAMPLIDFLVMPMALAGVLLMPFGLEQPFLAAMGLGIDGMLAVAARVSNWSEGSGGAAMPSAAALLLFVAGFLWLALLGERWRLAGLAPMLVATALAFIPSRPDLIVAADGRAVAIRGADGRYTILALKPTAFETGIWLRADGDPRSTNDPQLASGSRCDPLGCIGHLADGRIVALSLDRGAFDEDCRKAALVVSPITAPPACGAMTAVIDRTMLAQTGAVALGVKPPDPGGIRAAGEPRAEPAPGSLDEDTPSDPDEEGDTEGNADPAFTTLDVPQALANATPASPQAGKTPPTAASAGENSRLAAAFIMTAAYPPIRRAWMPSAEPR